MASANKLMVVFRRGPLGVEEGLQHLHQRLGIRKTRLAVAEHFPSSAPRGGDHGVLFADLGIASLQIDPAEARRLDTSSSSPIAGARPERVLRIPRFRVSPLAQIEDRTQAGISPAGGTPRTSWALEAIGAAGVSAGAGGREVKVALLDSGMSSHPDLPMVPPERQISCLPEDSATTDQLGHGTHCAGLLCGSAHPTRGPRVGVAPGSTLYVARVADAQGQASETAVVTGIRWALSKGCNVLSLSIGRPTTPESGPDPLYQSLVSQILGKGALVVASAGNESASTIDQPAATEEVMGVTALTRASVVAIWANRGAPIGPAAIDLAAPGVGIPSTWPDGGYRLLDGTSAATPLVAGVAALWFQQAPSLSGRDIWKRMCSLARPLTDPLTQKRFPLTALGHGLVQAPPA